MDKKKMFLLGASTYPKKEFEPENSVYQSMEFNPVVSPDQQARLNSEASLRDKKAKFNTLLQRSEQTRLGTKLPSSHFNVGFAGKPAAEKPVIGLDKLCMTCADS